MKAYADAAAFFGVAFFLGAAFLGAVFGVVLVTRPDLVLLRTAGFSATAGAWTMLDALHHEMKMKITYCFWCSSLLWLRCSLRLGSSFWLCDLGDLWLRGSLGLCSCGLLCGCGLLGGRLLLGGGLLLNLGLLGLRLGSCWLGLLLGELGSSGASCELLDAFCGKETPDTYPSVERRHPSRHQT